MQQHGFARNLDWEISATSADLQPDERDPSVELVLTDNDYTRGMWWVLFHFHASALGEHNAHHAHAVRDERTSHFLGRSHFLR
jgi:galactose mutarotase-like enzyme